MKCPTIDPKERKLRSRAEVLEDRKTRARTLIQRGRVAVASLLALALLTLNHYRLSIQDDFFLPSSPRGSIGEIGGALGDSFALDVQPEVPCSYDNPHRSTFMGSNASLSLNNEYQPAPIEKYLLDNLVNLGYDTSGDENAITCALQRDRNSPIYDDLQTYFRELEHYNDFMKNFEPIPDLRLQMDPLGSNIKTVCESVKIHPEGLEGIFKNKQLSKSTSVGYLEPLTPTLRSHKICDDLDQHLLSMDYLIHDFHAMCLKVKKHSRMIFVDMGASLAFHDNLSGEKPAFYINTIYRKFGFRFDHIYAFEIVEQSPSKVFQLVPNELQASWHWINVGVDPRPCSKMNPFTLIANNFEPDDFIVVKLDIDTPAVESLLARQLRDDPWLLELVDQFYFEDHVHQEELKGCWKESMSGTVKGSLELMAEIRKRGVAAHYWP